MSPAPVVAALGGKGLRRRGEPMDAVTQRRNVVRAVASLAPLAERGPLVVTYGDGPQVALLALEAAAYDRTEPSPLDVLGAETEDIIGYLLAQELRNALPGREVATLLTQVVVDPNDPAFTQPSRAIGPTYEQQQAVELSEGRGWSVGRDGQSLRRVVASPEPREMVELATIRLLLRAGTVVVCVGGGGIPVTVADDGKLYGIDAVIDKDLAAAQLAVELDAEALLLLTDVPAVQLGWGTGNDRPLCRATSRDLRALELAAGTMGPKVEAAARFTEQTGRRAAIGGREEADLLLDGIHGTTVGHG